MANEPRDLLQQIAPIPVTVRHAEYSLILSADDEKFGPTPFLLKTGLEAAKIALDISLDWLSLRLPQPPFYPSIWPGEHYRFLAALVKLLEPKLIVEIGTGGGLAALAMKSVQGEGGQVITFDVLPWAVIPETVFQQEDFADGKLIFFQEDLCDPAALERQRPMLEDANLILIDASKDGIAEKVLISHLRSIKFRSRPLVIFDDIRLWSMIKIWRELAMPKFDITSFGHWSGTGMVDWGAQIAHTRSGI